MRRICMTWAGCCLPYIPHACTARGRVGDPMVQRVCTEMTHVCWGHEAVESYVARSACRNIHAYPGTVSRLAILARTFCIFPLDCAYFVNQFYWTNPRIALVPGWSRWSQDDPAGRRIKIFDVFLFNTNAAVVSAPKINQNEICISQPNCLLISCFIVTDSYCIFSAESNGSLLSFIGSTVLETLTITWKHFYVFSILCASCFSLF